MKARRTKIFAVLYAHYFHGFLNALVFLYEKQAPPLDM
jgi:hypothetical protein